MFEGGWLWLYAGAFLMLAELISPGFVIFFFGLSAATVGLLDFALGDSFSLTLQLAAFSGLSILYLVFLRRALKKVFTGTTETSSSDFQHESVGRTGRVTEAIDPPLSGRILLGDAEWTATADQPIAAGENVRIIAQDNLTMKVERV